MTEDHVPEAKHVRYARLARIFTPRTPVAKRDRFAGRTAQVLDVLNAVAQPGTHVVLYGERGVGKTSLANVLSEFVQPLWDNIGKTVRINCTTEDSYKTIWTRVLDEMGIDTPETWALGKADPDSVRRLLRDAKPSLLILDEFDRVEDDEALSLMADTIKALSDHAVETRLVIVGVADSIDQLIGEHESISRAIAEVQLTRMTPEEASQIIDTGLAEAGMSIDPVAHHRIARLAEGLPHYVHLLCLESAQRAALDDRERVSTDDVRTAIDNITRKHSLLREYQTAVHSPRQDTLFTRVLAACALAEKNRLGYFTASAVRAPLSRIMGRQYDIPAFATHLKAFTGDERGRILQREGTERKYVYRFRNPLLQPFALLAALSEGMIAADYVDDVLGQQDRN